MQTTTTHRTPLQHLSPRDLDSELRIGGYDSVVGEPIRGGTGNPVPAPLVAPYRAALAVQRAGEFVEEIRGGATNAVAGRVKLNDSWATRQGGLGVAWFTPHREARISLAPQLTQDLLDGLDRLRASDFATWTATDRQRFVAANHVLLHESLHLALPEHTSSAIEAALGSTAARGLDEALTEHAARALLPGLLQWSYGVTIDPADAELHAATGSYTGEVARLDGLLDIAGIVNGPARDAVVGMLGDTMDPARRTEKMAALLAAGAGADSGELPPWVMPYVKEQIPRFIAQEPATMLADVVAGLRDAGAERPVDWEALKGRVDAMKDYRPPT